MISSEQYSCDSSRIRTLIHEVAKKIDALVCKYDKHGRIIIYPLDKAEGAIMFWNYQKTHGGEIMITPSRTNSNRATIDRFWGVENYPTLGTKSISTPTQLKDAAQIYEDLTFLLEEEFGKPVSSHDNRDIYFAELPVPAKIST